MNNYYEYKYGRYGYRGTWIKILDLYMVDIVQDQVILESQTKKLKRKEMEANVPKRALMLEKFFDNNLPHLLHLLMNYGI